MDPRMPYENMNATYLGFMCFEPYLGDCPGCLSERDRQREQEWEFQQEDRAKYIFSRPKKKVTVPKRVGKRQYRRIKIKRINNKRRK